MRPREERMGRLAYAEGGGSTGVAGLMEATVAGFVDEVESGVFETWEESPVAPGERFHALDPEWCEDHRLARNPYPDAPSGTFGQRGPRRDLPVYERRDGDVVTERTIRLGVERGRYERAGGRPATDERYVVQDGQRDPLRFVGLVGWD